MIWCIKCNYETWFTNVLLSISPVIFTSQVISDMLPATNSIAPLELPQDAHGVVQSDLERRLCSPCWISTVVLDSLVETLAATTLAYVSHIFITKSHQHSHLIKTRSKAGTLLEN